MNARLESAERLLAALHPSPPEKGGLDHAISTTVLLDALRELEPPRTLAQLLAFLEHRAPPSRGVLELAFFVRARLEREPGVSLDECVDREKAFE